MIATTDLQSNSIVWVEFSMDKVDSTAIYTHQALTQVRATVHRSISYQNVHRQRKLEASSIIGMLKMCEVGSIIIMLHY